MKKSVIIIIGVIYIASIVLIGFLGMKITSYDEIFYVNKIECINENAVEKEDGSKSIEFIYDENLPPEENVVQIFWKVYPEDATNRRVEFMYDKESKVGYVDNNGRVWLKRVGTLTVQIKSTDGSNIIQIVKIISKAL